MCFQVHKELCERVMSSDEPLPGKAHWKKQTSVNRRVG